MYTVHYQDKYGISKHTKPKHTLLVHVVHKNGQLYPFHKRYVGKQ